MNLHEYQAKQLFAAYGLPVSTGYACDTPEEVAEKTAAIGGNRWVVNHQMSWQDIAWANILPWFVRVP